MNNAFKVVGAIVLIAIVGFFALNAYIYNEKQADTEEKQEALFVYFEEQIIERGVNDIGMPIEGFDGRLLMQAFPGLMVVDFEGVQTFEGHYEVSSQGKLAFVRDQGQPVSSAETTVSSEGYRTLLNNVQSRLGIIAKDFDDINTIISHINTREKVLIQINASQTVLGVTLSPRAILEDSRCPIDVQCVWEGVVTVSVGIEGSGEVTEEVFEVGETIIFADKEITLDRVEPSPVEGKEIAESDYVLHFVVNEYKK